MADSSQFIDAVRRKEPEALAAFLDEHRLQLLAYIERRLGPALRRKVEPDDILQETSAEALRSLPTADLETREPFSWLCHLAEHRIIDAQRKFFGSQKRAAGREVPLQSPADSSGPGIVNLLVASMTTASQAFSRDQKQLRLLEALAKLPEESREALRLRYVEGLPSKTIAEQLGKSDGAIRVMLTRSLAKLQELVGEE